MPKPIHQRSVIYKQLNKYLPLLQKNITQTRNFLDYYRDVYKFPKTHTNRNIRKYDKMIKAIAYLLSVMDGEVKKSN